MDKAKKERKYLIGILPNQVRVREGGTVDCCINVMSLSLNLHAYINIFTHHTSGVSRRIVHYQDGSESLLTRVLVEWKYLRNFVAKATGMKLKSRVVESMSSNEEKEKEPTDEEKGEEDDDDCEPVKALSSHPICNGIHELDLLDDEIVAFGWWRIAWRMKTYDDEEELCLKTIR